MTDNANTGPLTAAITNIAELITTIQEQADQILVTIDVKDTFFMVPLQETGTDLFAFAWDFVKFSLLHFP